MYMFVWFLCSGRPMSSQPGQTKHYWENCSFNYIYDSMACKCRTSLQGRAYLFSVWKWGRRRGTRGRDRQLILWPWTHPLEGGSWILDNSGWMSWDFQSCIQQLADIAGTCPCSNLMRPRGKDRHFWPGFLLSSCNHFSQLPRDCWPPDTPLQLLF